MCLLDYRVDCFEILRLEESTAPIQVIKAIILRIWQNQCVSSIVESP